MTLLHDLYAPSTTSYEETEQERLHVIDQIDRAQQSPSLLRKFRSALVSRKALKLAKREEMYPAQSEDLLRRAVALNTGIEQRAHDVIDQMYAKDHPELSEAPFKELPPAKAVAHLVLERTVDLAHDLNDETPTVPIPIVVEKAVYEVTHEQNERLPESTASIERALRHIADHHQEKKKERLEFATNEQKSEEDDAKKLSTIEMRALLFDDDEEEVKSPSFNNRAA